MAWSGGTQRRQASALRRHWKGPAPSSLHAFQLPQVAALPAPPHWLLSGSPQAVAVELTWDTPSSASCFPALRPLRPFAPKGRANTLSAGPARPLHPQGLSGAQEEKQFQTCSLCPYSAHVKSDPGPCPRNPASPRKRFCFSFPGCTLKRLLVPGAPFVAKLHRHSIWDIKVSLLST